MLSISRPTKVMVVWGFQCKMLRTIGLPQSPLRKCPLLLLSWDLFPRGLHSAALSQHAAPKPPVLPLAVSATCSRPFLLSRAHSGLKKSSLFPIV